MMSQSIRDVVARMAVDAAFAERVRTDAGAVAKEYGLGAPEIEKLQGLLAADPGSGPVDLGARQSRSAIGTGGLASLLASLGDAPPVAETASPQFSGPMSEFMFNPQPEPPGDPAAAPDLSPPGGDVGLYPWDSAPGDPFSGESTMAPEAPGEDKGIIVIGSQPDPGASGEDKGIIVIGGQPDPGASGEDKGIIVIGGQPDPAAPGEDKGIIIVGTQPDPAAPGEDKGIIIVDTQPDPGAPGEDKGIIIVNSRLPEDPFGLEPDGEMAAGEADDAAAAGPTITPAPVKPIHVSAPSLSTDPGSSYVI